MNVKMLSVISGILLSAALCMAGNDTTAAAAEVDQISGASTPAVATEQNRVFTVEELAHFDGQDGRPAYVAVDGIVYDLTPVKKWKNGRHHGHIAGTDLTEMIKTKSPHKLKVLKKLKSVGTLKTE